MSRPLPPLLRAAACALLLALPTRAGEPEERAWEGSGLVVFGVGVLEFQDQQLATYPQEGRRDAQLMELLRQRGAREVVFLRDREATRARIERDFAALLGRTQPGQTLVVYYTGHGFRANDGQVGFAPWDSGEGVASTWQVRSIVEAVEARFRGSRALLLADCCHSGALADATASHSETKLAWACLTSAWATSQSTGHWTFTESLLDALRGDPRADADASGAVSLGELASFAEAEMAFGEEQLTRFHAGAGWPPELLLARARGERPVVQGGAAGPGPRVGERLEVRAEGEWWKARVLAVEGERLKVRFYGWDESFDEWVEPSRVRQRRVVERPVGQKVEVESEGKWYPATVTETRLGLTKVTYQGYDSSWDEWVPSARIRAPGEKPRGKRRLRRRE